jgi:hypothetical protein
MADKKADTSVVAASREESRRVVKRIMGNIVTIEPLL